ncbi:hypothetical protein [Kitasatospora purpeofusca]|uniref:hypothetical protein n=1 Tax=Kitasatospora purpeofusca TaxID=67352 RepID=UPI0022530402|nr:hypothetical protein [Kitasatospora purpeofusca]MCX4757100.1 hypothetical protein [Kitasatospora purpeofusca]WSR35138.1 hypothetical protein OG715_31785 [Kitasatospora purpeofusca]
MQDEQLGAARGDAGQAGQRDLERLVDAEPRGGPQHEARPAVPARSRDAVEFAVEQAQVAWLNSGFGGGVVVGGVPAGLAAGR